MLLVTNSYYPRIGKTGNGIFLTWLEMPRQCEYWISEILFNSCFIHCIFSFRKFSLYTCCLSKICDTESHFNLHQCWNIKFERTSRNKEYSKESQRIIHLKISSLFCNTEKSPTSLQDLACVHLENMRLEFLMLTLQLHFPWGWREELNCMCEAYSWTLTQNMLQGFLVATQCFKCLLPTFSF